MLLWSIHLALLLTGILSISQIGAQFVGACDSSRLLRCQQDILRDLQSASGLNSASVQFAVSGPPYSPSKIITSQTSCRLVRSNLDCLLQTTPACYDYDIPSIRNTDYILRGKKFLEQNGCNEPNGNWDQSTCYKSPEMRTCEEMYDTSLANANLYATNSHNFTYTCPFYHRFKNCVDYHIRMNCRVQDTDMINEYLIDKAGQHAWRCGQNVTGSGSNNFLGYVRDLVTRQFATQNAPGQSLYPSYSQYDQQRPLYDSTYNTAFSDRLRLRPSEQQAWQRFGSLTSMDDRKGGGAIGHFPGQMFDRLVAPADYNPVDCVSKAAIFIRECENRLIDDQRRIIEIRDSFELERKSCCSLDNYKRCITRTVLDRCNEASPLLAVEYFMGRRERELRATCLGMDTTLCSGSMSDLLYNGWSNVAITILTMISMSLYTNWRSQSNHISS